MSLSVKRRTMWRGVPLDERTAAAMADLAPRVGPLLQPTQGSFRPATRYSADTHAGAGAIDLSVRGMTRAQEREVIIEARRMGFAAWVRAAIPGLWVRHIHMILIPPDGHRRNNGGLASGAWGQVLDYYAGRNGLANRGPDDGPRLNRIITYEQWSTIQTTKAAAEQAAQTVRELQMRLTKADAPVIQSAVHSTQIGRSGKTIGMALERVFGIPNTRGVESAVWSSPVTRNGTKIPALQELADCKTGIHRLETQMAALTAAVARIEKEVTK